MIREAHWGCCGVFNTCNVMKALEMGKNKTCGVVRWCFQNDALLYANVFYGMYAHESIYRAI